MSADFDKLSLDDSPDAVIATTTEGRVLYWSNGAQAMFGYGSDETVGRSLDELLVPPDRVDEERSIARDAMEGGFSTYDSHRRRKDGSLIHVCISTHAVRDAQGDVDYLLSSMKDVTDLKERRDAKLVETRFRELLESMPDGIVMVNANGRIVLSNSQAQRMFGYEAAELRGRSIELLVPERFRAGHVNDRSSFHGRPRTRAMGRGLDLYGLRKDGTEFPADISLKPLQTEKGTIVVSAIRDITERKQFERELEEKNVELARAMEAKDRFLANMSHELRTPLNAIIGFTGTLLMKLPGPLNPDQEKQLKTVQASARHLLALINDLLDLARIEAGKLELNLEPMPCREILLEAAETLRPLAQGKGLELLVEAPDEKVTVRADRRALSQIVLNLGGNAIKFTDRGSVRLALGRRQVDGRGVVEISVQDTGIGIRAEDHAKLFAAFTQADERAKQRHEGTGLGLHLSQKLAALLGGKIVFSSEHGRGSTFTLRLEAD